jgi:UDP-glucose 4-epimerase
VGSWEEKSISSPLPTPPSPLISMQSIPQKIRELRQKADLTQNALAERSGVSPAFIYKLEAGEYETLSLETCRQLAKGLELGLRGFLDATGLLEEDEQAEKMPKAAAQKKVSDIAIIGVGKVGGAIYRYFLTKEIEPAIYDPLKGYADPSVLADAKIIFITVPTPYYIDGRGFDDSFLHDAIRTIPIPGKTIVLKSTILPGTTDALQRAYPQHRILFNPEFLTESRIDKDMQFPTRQIVGYTQESRCDAETVMDLLPAAPFQKIIPAKAAEMVKYFGNAFYALKVAYANQMFDLCQALDVDYELVKECGKAEPWMGEMHWDIFHRGYRGYGGKCLPKDTRSVLQLGKNIGVDLTLLQTAEDYNNSLQEKQGIDVAWKEGSPEKGDEIQKRKTAGGTKRYMVTGGAGFIGSALARQLIKEGNEVVIIDNLSTGKKERIPTQAIFIEADLTDLESVKPHFENIDGVFHCAALPRVAFSVDHPIESSNANIFGTLNTLIAARDAGVKRVVYSASSSAYGDQKELPQHPAMKTKPLSPYALQKLVGEHYCSQYASLHGLETVSLRYFNVYGPEMSEDGAYAPAFAIFKRQKLAGDPLTIFGDGSQTRSFCHVYDVVRANILAMQSEIVGRGEVLNVGGGRSISIRDIAERFHHPIKYLDPRPGDVPHTQADNSLTKRLIGWEPQVDFDDGFAALMEHWRLEKS